MKKGLFLSLIAAAVMLASCNNTLQNPEQINVNPSPLTKVGNKVNAEITGTFPAKKFAKKGVLVVTPVLKYEGQEAVGEPVTLYGHEIVFKGQEFADDMREKYYIYTVDGREVRALTKLHANGEDAAREPAIDKTIGGDIYIAPTPPKSSGRQELILKHGRMDMDDLFAYRFEGVTLEEQGGGKMLVKAVIAVTDGDTIERVEPAIQATLDGGTSKAVDVFGGQKRIRLTGVSADQRQARIEILPPVEAEVQQAITTSVSTKPFIWVLWLGSVLVCVGTLAAVKR